MKFTVVQSCLLRPSQGFCLYRSRDHCSLLAIDYVNSTDVAYCHVQKALFKQPHKFTYSAIYSFSHLIIATDLFIRQLTQTLLFIHSFIPGLVYNHLSRKQEGCKLQMPLCIQDTKYGLILLSLQRCTVQIITVLLLSIQGGRL